MLILFDIDGTLVSTTRSGSRAMGDAGRAMIGSHFREDAVEYAGRLDPLIVEDLLTAHSIKPTVDAVNQFRRLYKEFLVERLAEPGAAMAHPGVETLVGRLEARGDMTLGLLTGNYPETGRIKLQACGLDPSRFAVQVWGCDSPNQPPGRDDLPKVGMKLHQQAQGEPIEPGRVVIIGDTPYDVQCARVNGCRSLGVATGPYTIEQLEQAGADLAMQSLADVDKALAWILNGD